MPRFRFVAAVIAALVAVDIAVGGNFWDSAYVRQRPGASSYVAEAGGALVGGGLVCAGAAVAGAIVVSALWSFPSPSGDPYDPSPLLPALVGGIAGAALGYPCGSACGTTTVGSWQDRDGNNGLAYAGAFLGLPVGIGLACLGALAQGSALEIPLYAAGVLAPPAGAVIGYNLRITKERPPTSFGARLAPPTLAFSSRLGPDQQRYSAFDCRLVTVRF
jgi:hypothetical protein